MRTNKTDKLLFLGLSTLSIASLVGSFAYPLQKLELYRQTEVGQFDIPITRTYLITENSLNKPFGFQAGKAKLFAQIHVDYKVQKILLLALATGCSVVALSLGKTLVPQSEYEEEISRLQHEGEKELFLKAIKQRFSIANKSQQLLFLDDLKTLMSEFGNASMEEESMTVDELNAIYEEQEKSILNEPVEESSESDQGFRATFGQQLDQSSWKACLKALSSGASKDEVIKDVLGGTEHATSYYEFLVKQNL